MGIELRYTAVGSGYFKVQKNGVVVPPNHTSEREAVEHASNLELANPADDISYYHDYKVNVEAVTVPDPDTAGPSVVITVSDTNLTVGETATVTFSFSEPVMGFDASDIRVHNGTLGPLTLLDDGHTYQAVFTPTVGVVDSSNTVSITGTYTDTAGNAGAEASSPNYEVNTYVPPPPPPPVEGFPAWRQGLPMNVFTKIPGTAPKNLVGFPSPFFNDYSGVATDLKDARMYTVASGGHASGGDDNYVTGVDLMEDAPKWKMLRGSSGRDAGGIDKAYFPDGRPTGCHNYYNTYVIDVDGRKGLLRVGNSSGSNHGYAYWFMDCFWLDTMDWDLFGVGWPDYAVEGYCPRAASVCQDPETQKIYGAATTTYNGTPVPWKSKFRVFDPVTRTWGNWGNNNWGGGYGGCVFLPKQRKIAFDYGAYRNDIADANGRIINVYDLATVTHKTVSLVWITPKPFWFGKEGAMTYDSDNDRIYWTSGYALMRINPNNWETEYIGVITPARNAVYNRMVYIPRLKGLIYASQHANDMEFMPTSLDPLPVPNTEPWIEFATVNGYIQKLSVVVGTAGDKIIGKGKVIEGAIVSVDGVNIIGQGPTDTHIIGGGNIEGKGALVLRPPTATSVSGINFRDVRGETNGAAIRHSSGKLTVATSRFKDCNNGYLGTASVDFTDCEFDSCGYGDGFTHAIYSGATAAGESAALVTVTNSKFRNTKIGHHLKSRAKKTVVNGATMEAGTESYSCDFPWGGEVEIVGLNAVQGAATDNIVLINYGSETNATPHPTHSFAISNSVLESMGVAKAIAIRIDAKTPVVVYATNVDFNGFSSKIAGGGVLKVVYTNCRENGVAIPDTV